MLSELERALGPGVYSRSNLCLSATHTHSGPGGYMGRCTSLLHCVTILRCISGIAMVHFCRYFLFSVTTLGFDAGVFDAMVTGITRVK